MLRKFTVLYLVVIVFMPLVTSFSERNKPKEPDRVSLFFVDRQMMRLVESDFYIYESTPEDKARMVVSELINGRDENDMVRRMLPDSRDAIDVTVSGGIAYVDINEKYMEFYEKGKIQEQLIVYQIVNSLSSVEGISRVKFLFDGEEKKEFVGEIDMREAFVPDYNI